MYLSSQLAINIVLDPSSSFFVSFFSSGSVALFRQIGDLGPHARKYWWSFADIFDPMRGLSYPRVEALVAAPHCFYAAVGARVVMLRVEGGAAPGALFFSRGLAFPPALAFPRFPQVS